jgi:hypothetical protein
MRQFAGDDGIVADVSRNNLGRQLDEFRLSWVFHVALQAIRHKLLSAMHRRYRMNTTGCVDLARLNSRRIEFTTGKYAAEGRFRTAPK